MPHLARFLHQLIENGHVQIPLHIDPLAPFDHAAAVETLHISDQIMRSHLGGNAPAFVDHAAIWAAHSLFLSAWLFLNRKETTDVLLQHLNNPSIEPNNADHIYSVDLSFRFLPDLWQHIAQRASQDPLALLIRDLAAQWPLSSVGMGELSPLADSCDTLLAHPKLRQLYIDRILQHDDVTRLQHPEVKDGIRAGLGSYLSLAPVNLSIALEAASSDSR